MHAWERFGIWLVIGLVLYFGYGSAIAGFETGQTFSRS